MPQSVGNPPPPSAAARLAQPSSATPTQATSAAAPVAGAPVAPDAYATGGTPVRFLAHPSMRAEKLMLPLESGSFELPKRGGRSVRGHYFDFAVQNFAFDKRMTVTVRLHREDGAVEDFLARLQYKGKLGDGRERWGADLPVFHDSGPHGKVKDITFDYSVAADADGDGRRDFVPSGSTYRIDPAGGPPTLVGPNERAWKAVDPAKLDEAAKRLAATRPPMEVYFTPDRGARDAVVREIDQVIAAKKADPNGHHYIHASIYNINSGVIADRLIKAHKAGVEVRLLTSAPQMMPDRPWEVHYRRLQSAGIDLVGVMPYEHLASNHTKLVDFDGKVVATGSFNWEDGAEQENFENLVILRSPEAALIYESIFTAIAGGDAVRTDRVKGPAKVAIHYSQAEDGLARIIDEVNSAKKSITICQFQVRDAKDEKGRSLVDAIGKAAERGVAVTLITDKRIADGGEFHGIQQVNDQTDEGLEARGVHVVKVLSPHGEYASMHNKFAVFDGARTFTGSYNWWGPSETSDDEFTEIEDPVVARVFQGEARNLQARFDPDFDRGSAPKTTLDFRAQVPSTKPGDEVYVVGDAPELGAWDPAKGVKLDGSSYPEWTGAVEIPEGVAFRYKYMIRGADGGVRWEGGFDRARTADPTGARTEVREKFA